MSYTVNISEAAENDLRAVFTYIAVELRAYANAAGQLARLEAGIDSLSEMPERYRRYDKEPWRSRGLPAPHGSRPTRNRGFRVKQCQLIRFPIDRRLVCYIRL